MFSRSLVLRAPRLICSIGFIALWAIRAAEPPQVCADQPALGTPEWTRSAVVYEVNTRQYSAAGTFAAVEADLPRIRALGADVLWFMPVHPIGEHNRKGPLGSPYAVRDYYGINAEFGTAADFRKLVDAAHQRGFHVVLDWVGNHTAWDNPLAQQHPDYYVRDAKGSFVPPLGFDWTDVIQLDFNNHAVWDYEYEALAYWIREFGIDGFRCDFATGVPTKFWEEVSARLRKLRPDLFLLAESELPQQQLLAFNASYAFEMMQTFNAVAQGRACVSHIDDTMAATRAQFPHGATLLRYTTNHDENSWQGTEFERLGGGASTFAVLSFMLDGIPLIYNGQEIGLDRRLAFFERDPIVWREHPLTHFYRTLCNLRHQHSALRTGSVQRRLDTTRNEAVYALLRESGDDRIVALLNLTARDVSAEVFDPALAGKWRDAFTNEIVESGSHQSISLQAWRYRVLIREQR
jgi:glycosidase